LDTLLGNARPVPRVFPVMSALLILIALGQAPAAGRELTRTETESRARQDLTVRLGVPARDVHVVSSDSRTWPDPRLGCVAARRGVEEPIPVSGYRIVLEADGKRYAYHTDLAGRIVRCEESVKRLLPMLR
jgi:hypothetical protein